MAHTRSGIARYVSRSHYWRGQLAAAQTPAERFMHTQRWLLALARQAGQSGRRQDADADAFADAADDAFSEAAGALAEICRKFEQRIAPGTRGLW
jgi:uncharacterized protein YecA (UPF0149 family)